MEYRNLGSTGIRVSRLCFGTLGIGPLQSRMPLVDGVSLLEESFSQGINFFDTAQLYLTYPYLKALLHGKRDRIVIATKSYAYTEQDMAVSLEEALRELDTDYVDLFLLHEQESELTLQGHQEALDYLVKAKKAGKVRAVGISTHAVRGCLAGIVHPSIEVIHPLLNRMGIGIIDGTTTEMQTAVSAAAAIGKGLYGMKALAGGNLINDAEVSLHWAFSENPLDSLAVGMKNEAELQFAIAVEAQLPIPVEVRTRVGRIRRNLHIEEWCVGCSACVTRCSQKALSISDGQAVVDSRKCILCGYCAAACRDFCLKIV